MNATTQLDFDLEELPMDVFELTEGGMTVESLTGDHGIDVTNFSFCCWSSCSGGC